MRIMSVLHFDAFVFFLDLYVSSCIGKGNAENYNAKAAERCTEFN